MLRLVAVVGLLVMMVPGCSSGAAPSTPPAPSTQVPSSGGTVSAGGKHIVVVYLENHGYSEIVDGGCCPYESALAHRGIQFTNFYGVTYPSLPNYLAFGGGDVFGRSGSDEPVPLVDGQNVFSQMAKAGIPWQAWAEDYPGGTTSCDLSPEASSYALRHVAPLLFRDVAETSLCHSVSAAEPGALPRFLWVTPNMCNDDHDCGPATGDRWLADHVPGWLAQGAQVFITYDTGNPDHTNGGGHVYAVLLGRGIHPRVEPALMNHYSALAGVERALHLPLLGNARVATPVPFS